MIEQIHQAPEALPLSRKCQLAGLSRATYYRHAKQAGGSPASSEKTALPLRQSLHRIALETSGYGYRRMTHHLHREGIKVNHKKVRRLMQEENLLIPTKKRFVITTDSDHDGPFYPNLAKKLEVSEPDKLWVADITYVRLPHGFCYLAALLDAYSRRCLGWAVESYLDARLPLKALQMALASREVSPDLVHHSDRGTQYACQEYTEALKVAGIKISMSRRGNPYDNAKAESFFKSVKIEEVYVNDYRTTKEARENIGAFLEAVYNQKRLHSALGYLPPAEFEQQYKQQQQNNAGS
jgi:transposase InsO family protein